MNRPDGSEQRNNLALVRTELANERTLLAYGRTGLIFVGSGVSLIKFLNVGQEWVIVGWTLCGTGVIIALLGVIRFARLHRRLRGS